MIFGKDIDMEDFTYLRGRLDEIAASVVATREAAQAAKEQAASVREELKDHIGKEEMTDQEFRDFMTEIKTGKKIMIWAFAALGSVVTFITAHFIHIRGGQ